MQIAHFGRRVSGPEEALEVAVGERLPDLFGPADLNRVWAASSLPLGAGKPDLIFARFEPRVFALANMHISDTQVLAYLRVVRRARVETISERMSRPEPIILRSLEFLLRVKAVEEDDKVFSIVPEWKHVLPEVISIENKVSDWRRAGIQAARNLIFSHRSFAAFPHEVAVRVRKKSFFCQHGIGVLGVMENGDVSLVRRARHCMPRVWSYYYELAAVIARVQLEEDNAIQHLSH